MFSNDTYQIAPRHLRMAGLIAAVLALGTAAAGIVTRFSHQSTLRQWTEQQAIPSVALVEPQTDGDKEALNLPGNLRAFIEAPIYARVNGYLKRWYVDIGAHVTAGQRLAEIETPELDQQVQQAQADLATADANEHLADITAKRWLNMLSADSVSKQEADEKVGDYDAKKANKEAAQANLRRLLQIESFKNIVAPFAGVVTARKTDVGALINAGAGSGQELFRIADTHKCRVYVEVPQTYAASIHVGMKAQLKLPENANDTFPAVVTDTSQSISESSRTLLVELVADNGKGALLPGAYADVSFTMPSTTGDMRLPISALLFQKNGLEVATLTKDNKVLMKHVVMGRDFGKEVEIVSGLQATDRVIDSPYDSIADNDLVNVADAATAPDGASKT